MVFVVIRTASQQNTGTPAQRRKAHTTQNHVRIALTNDVLRGRFYMTMALVNSRKYMEPSRGCVNGYETRPVPAIRTPPVRFSTRRHDVILNQP